tara:strand:+ start:245 stop:514 length:270 start_codon:yes stop_codon:yes gene_type:complete
MIFKTFPEGTTLEYRCDVTMRADALEYDITIKNSGDACESTMEIDAMTSAGPSGVKGYDSQDGSKATKNSWTVPKGKFTDTCFYAGWKA